ncbi:FKBP-type peptidyl-prolyl cis-trans isomerase [Nonlabens marinus]|nr:FKBP-type peptidyl-prolyl cis-trans isomerase [Nonlabens marinus]
MKNLKLQFLILIFLLVSIACSPDDGPDAIPIRDRQEVYIEDLAKINAFLNTHFYNEDEFQNTPAGADFEIKFDTIAGANSGRTPLSQQVVSQTITRDGVDYKLYTLKVREGSGARQPTFADSALVSYEGTLLNGNVFDSSINSIWFDLPSTITGFTAGVTQFKDASAINPNGDGTLSYEGSGIGAVFIPSGLGYFERTQSGIPAYSPIIFTFKLRRAKTTDHDSDGIFSKFEDLNNDKNLRSPNFADDTDRDGRFNYLEIDDDNDGILTVNENADPNGDGNPNDALDTDGDGIPDYLDARTEN